MGKYKAFADKESYLYNDLFKSRFTGEILPIPSMVLQRAQARYFLFVQSLEPTVVTEHKDDFMFLFECIKTLSERQEQPIMSQARSVYGFIVQNRPFWTIDMKYTTKERAYREMFLYSVLDFIRNCEFENEEPCPIDLNRLALLTDSLTNFESFFNKPIKKKVNAKRPQVKARTDKRNA